MANRCFQLTLTGVALASYNQTALHFQSGGTSDNDTLAAGESLNAAFETSLRTLWLNTLPGDYNLMSLRTRRVDLKPSATAISDYQYGTQYGNRTGAVAGLQTCPSVFLIPTMGTKSGNRIFWPCIAGPDIVLSIPTSAWQTTVNTFLAAAIAGVTSGGMTWTLCTYSRKLNSFGTVAGHNFSPVVGFQGRRRTPVGAT